MSDRPGKQLTHGPQSPALGLLELPHVRHISAGHHWLPARANSDQRLSKPARAERSTQLRRASGFGRSG
jgi:hypothetical protein